MAGSLGSPLRHRDLTSNQLHIDKYVSSGTAAPDDSSDFLIYLRDNGNNTSTMYWRSSTSYKFKPSGADVPNEAV